MKLIIMIGSITKIKKYLFSIIIGICITSYNNAQELITTKDYRFVGYDKEKPLFKIYDENKSDSQGIYSIKKSDDVYGFYLIKQYPIRAKNIQFIYNEFYIEGQGTSVNNYKLNIYQNEKFLLTLNTYGLNYSYSDSKNVLIISAKKDDWDGLIFIDMSLPSIDPIYLPLKGYRSYIVDDWLYFAYYHENYDYSPYPDDIFRVKIGDWHNPELVFTSDVSDDWFLYPESHVIATDIDLNDKGLNKNNEILYDVKKKAYAIVPNMNTNRSSSSAYLKYEGKYYGYYKRRDVETIGLELLPPLPKSFPNKEINKVLPREVWYNVPLKEKTFEGTFVTPYLLREASRSELSKLDKSQLRLLRNAIYAQYGYVFKSKELQGFYRQFEWYRMMTVRRKNNDDIILLPEDKERAELIREVEEG